MRLFPIRKAREVRAPAASRHPDDAMADPKRKLRVHADRADEERRVRLLLAVVIPIVLAAIIAGIVVPIYYR